MAQNFVAATVLNIDDIKNQLRKASNTINVFRSNRDVIPVKHRVTKVGDRDLGNHFTLDSPFNGILDSPTLELDTGLGSLTNLIIKWRGQVVKEFLYVDDFIDSSLTTASVVGSSGSVSFTDGEVFVSDKLTSGVGSVSSATLLDVGNLSGTGSFSYFMSSSESGSIEAPWYEFNESSGIVASDSSGTNAASFQYTGNNSSTGLVGYYPFDDGSAADETNNSNDGTLSSGTVIDNIDSLTGWSGGSGTSISLNTTNYLYGTGAMNIYGADTDTDFIVEKSFSPMDLSGEVLTYYVYINDQETLDSLQSWIFYLYEGGNFNRYGVTVSTAGISTGWNILRVDVDNPNSSSGVVNTALIDRIRINIEGQHAGFTGINEGSFILDYIQYGAPIKDKDHLGNENGSLYFSGSEAGISKSGALFTGNVDFTIGFWIKTTATAQTYLIQQRDSVSTDGQWVVQMSNTGRINLWDFSSGTYGFSNSNYSTGSVNDGEWHRVIISKRGTGLTYYIDGVASGTNTSAGAVTYANRNFYIGYDGRDNDKHLKGSLSEVFVYSNYGFNSYEVADDYVNSQIHKWNDPIDTADNNAIRVNGSTQYKLSAPVTLDNNGSAIAWSMYVSQNLWDRGLILFAKNWYGGDNHIVFRQNAGELFEIEGNINNSGVRITYPSALTTEAWHHFVISFNQGIVTCYVDGEEFGSYEYFGVYSSTFDDVVSSLALIGNNNNNFSYGDIIEAKFRDVRYFPNNSLTQDDVTWLYNSGSEQINPASIKWESVTLNTKHDFTYVGSNLRYKIVSSGTNVLSVLESDNTYKPIRLSYNLL